MTHTSYSKRPFASTTLFVRTPLAVAMLMVGAISQAQTVYRTPSVGTQAFQSNSPVCAPAQINLGGFDATQVAPLAQAAFASRYTVKVLGDQTTAQADGQTVIPLRLEITDANGLPVQNSVAVSIEVIGLTGVGNALAGAGGAGGSLELACEYDPNGPVAVHGQKIDRVKPTQTAVTLAENGTLAFGLKAPAFANTLLLRIRAGDALVNHRVVFTPALQDMVVAGLVELRVRKEVGKNINVLGLTDDDVFAKELRHLSRDFANGQGQVAARGSMFLKGKVAGETLLTIAYDSEKEPRGRLLKDLDPNSFYPVYGDASTKGNDAPTDSKLYVRIDSGRSYALYGDFSTQQRGGRTALAPRNLGQYGRSLTGVKVHAEGELGFIEVFGALDNQRQVVDEFSGQGVSGPYTISTPNSLANTERVEIVTRDRFNPAVVIDIKPQQRLVDYELDPFAQRLLFKQPIPSLDANFNPVSIRVSYEVEQGGKEFWVQGAAAQVVLGKDVVLSAGVVKDSNPVAPYQIASVAAGAQLGSKTTFNVELAQSSTTVNSTLNIGTAIAPNPTFNGELTGKAASAELKYAGDVVAARLYAGRSDETFYNPQSSLSAGKQEWVASAAVKVTPRITVKAQASQNKDLQTTSDRQVAQVGVEAKMGDYIIVELGARKVQETAAAGALGASTPGLGNSQGYYGGVGLGSESAGAIDPATGLSIAGSTFTGGAAGSSGVAGQALDYTSARAKVTAVISPKSRASLEFEQDLDHSDRRLITASADYQLAQDGTRVYARVENGQSWYAGNGLNGSQSGTFARVGLQTPWLGGDAFSEYRMRSAISGEAGEMAYGLKHTIKVSDNWRASSAIEAVQTVYTAAGSTKSKAYAVALGAEYLGSATSKASARLELRTDAVADNWLSTVNYANKLSPDWTWLTKNYFSASQAKAASGVDTQQDRFITGLAYRPVDSNQLNGLFKYEMRLEKSGQAQAAVTDINRQVHIVGAHLDYHPSRPVWINARLANKWVKETLSGANSSYSMSVLGLRATYDITDHVSVGLQGSLLKGQYGAYQRAIGAELGYLVSQNVWATLGYNVRGYKDIDASVGMQTNKGWNLGLKYKFDEDVFSGSNPAVNKTLAP